MAQSRVHIVLNPASAGGRTRVRQGAIWSAIVHYLGDAFSSIVTQRPLEATQSVRAAILQGCELIVAVGGDGTIQEVVNGFFSDNHLINPGCRLGILSSGSGCGFAQSLGLPKSLEQQLAVICEGHAEAIDIGRVTYHGVLGENEYRYFVNECQVGIGAEVVKKVQQNHKRFGGRIGFALGTLQTLFSYKDQPMQVVVDGLEVSQELLAGVVIANGAFMGGGMNLTPGAVLNDGRLNVLIIRSASVTKKLQAFARIYSGRHVNALQFEYIDGDSVALRSSENVSVAADGELLGTTPCFVETLPATLKVLRSPS